MRKGSLVYKDKGLIWFFRRTKSGNLIPAPSKDYPEGFSSGEEAQEVLQDLQAGNYDGCPAGDHYVATECQFRKV